MQQKEVGLITTNFKWGLFFLSSSVFACGPLLLFFYEKRKLQELRQNLAEQLRVRQEEIRRTLSHSIRMPLSVAMGYADLLARGLIQEEKERKLYLDRMCKRLKELNESFNGLLNEMEEGETDLSGCVREFTEAVRETALKNGIRIFVKGCGNGITVYGKKVDYQRILYNLLENSIKYAGEGSSVTIAVSAERKKEAVLVFRDNGKGLEETETAHIFEKGFRGSNSREGSGFGLYMVRQMILEWGGFIHAKSKKGLGMEIIMGLPRTEEKKERYVRRIENNISC